MEEFDIVAIGDIVTDAFIRLQDASVNCDINHEACQLCVRFGDKVPFESVEIISAVGNSANAAVSGARLSLRSALITNIGDDQIGKETLAQLEKEKVSTKYVASHAGMKSNYHYVLWYESERTILVKHEDYQYTLDTSMPPPKWLYVSSMGMAAERFHNDISAYLMLNPSVKLAFQPGTFQLKLGTEKLKALYQQADIFFCNVEEARRLLNTLEEDHHVLLNMIHQLGPKMVVMTDGPKGAYVLSEGSALFMPPYPDPKPPFERTGAGDAFASTIVATLALGRSLEDALKWGAINSMSVVQDIGAQRGLLTQEKILRYLADAPTSFAPQKL